MFDRYYFNQTLKLLLNMYKSMNYVLNSLIIAVPFLHLFSVFFCELLS